MTIQNYVSPDLSSAHELLTTGTSTMISACTVNPGGGAVMSGTYTTHAPSYQHAHQVPKQESTITDRPRQWRTCCRPRRMLLTKGMLLTKTQPLHPRLAQIHLLSRCLNLSVLLTSGGAPSPGQTQMKPSFSAQGREATLTLRLNAVDGILVQLPSPLNCHPCCEHKGRGMRQAGVCQEGVCDKESLTDAGMRHEAGQVRGQAKLAIAP
jgi:hypothetical protein